MDIIYILFIAIIGIILSIGVGLKLSSKIDDFVIYVLFWMLYIISIITFINIILATYYYINMKNKSGQPGQIGEQGDRGEQGQTGLCDSNCRDTICETQILITVKDKLKEKNLGVEVDFQNEYIKSKIRQMCGSNEFKQLAPYNGPQNLINYLKDIWKIWIDEIFNAGSVKYFEMLGGEMEFEWLKENPFNEIKKYDVFYWGMGKQYRPEIIEKCYRSSDGNKPDNILEQTGYILQTSPTNIYELLGNDSGSRAYNDVSFWRAKQFTYNGTTFFPIGDLAYGPNSTGSDVNISRYVGDITMQYNMGGPNRETILVAGDITGPIDYNLIWKSTRGTPFWVWRPIPPSNYISLGDVVTFSSAKPGTNDNAPIRCVPKSITISLPHNRKILWSSAGSGMNPNANILGFIPTANNNLGTKANTTNAYNMFRIVVGNNINIPKSDINGLFYYLDPSKYDSQKIIGKDIVIPDTSIDTNKVGRGYIPDAPKDGKYSIMTYVNLKNTPILKHKKTLLNITAQLIPNAISNAYLLQVNDKCLKFNGKEIILAECDELQEEQIFSILFTGNAKNECKIQHYNSQKMLKYKNGIFTLVDANTTSEIDYQLFTMQ